MAPLIVPLPSSLLAVAGPGNQFMILLTICRTPMFDRPFDSVFLAGFLIYVAVRGYYERRARGQEVVARHRDVREICLLVGAFAGCLVLPVLYLATPWLAFADYAPPEFLRWLGIPTLIAALWLFWRAHRDLGANWSVTLEIHAGHHLVTHGVYRRIRHPMYAAIWLFSLAQGLMLGNWLAGWSAVAGFGLLYCLRIEREERMLLAQFGDAFRLHRAATGRLWPRFRSPSAPALSSTSSSTPSP